MPRLSWLLPVYNAENYLGQTLDSLQSQDFDDFVVYILNDGSTDGSAQIAEGVCAGDQRFRLVSKNNSGLIDTLNIGLSMVETDYIARIDADDICMPERARVQIDYLDRHPECVLVASRAELIDSEGKSLGFSKATERRPAGAEGFPPERHAVRHPTVMGRTAAFRQAGGYSRHYHVAEDYELWMRMRAFGEIHELPDHLIRYRYHEASESARKTVTQGASCVRADVVSVLRSRGAPEAVLTRAEQTPEIEKMLAYCGGLCGLPAKGVLLLYLDTAYLRLMQYRNSKQEIRDPARRLLAALAREAIGGAPFGQHKKVWLEAAKEYGRYAARRLAGRIK